MIEEKELKMRNVNGFPAYLTWQKERITREASKASGSGYGWKGKEEDSSS